MELRREKWDGIVISHDRQLERVPLGGVDRAVAQLGARHLFIRAGRPQTNGCVERVQQHPGGVLEAGFARYLIPEYTGLRLEVGATSAITTPTGLTPGGGRGRTPEDVLGMVKMWSR